MKTAKEVRAMANKIIVERTAEQKARALTYIENTLMPEIEKDAQIGIDYFSIPPEISRQDVVLIFVENGYYAEMLPAFGRIVVRW